MNVYAIKASGFYGGGMAIVVAPDKATAQLVASQTIHDHWQTRYDTPDEVELLPVEMNTEEPFVLAHYETGE